MIVGKNTRKIKINGLIKSEFLSKPDHMDIRSRRINSYPPIHVKRRKLILALSVPVQQGMFFCIVNIHKSIIDMYGENCQISNLSHKDFIEICGILILFLKVVFVEHIVHIRLVSIGRCSRIRMCYLLPHVNV